MVYELVWKNQHLNYFTKARSGTYTPMHEKKSIRTYMHVHITELLSPEYTSETLLLFLLSRKKVVVTICQWIQAFLFGSFHMQAQILHTSINTHTHTHICTYTGSLTHKAYKHKATKTNTGLHFSL